MEWATLPLRKYSDFTGRARRKEYWSFVLLTMAAYIVTGLVDGFLGLGGLVLGVYGPLTTLALLVLLTPSLSVAVRRLHDIDRSGWWLLLGLVPVVGGLVLLYWFVLEGTPGPNAHGADPLAGERKATAEMV